MMVVSCFLVATSVFEAAGVVVTDELVDELVDEVEDDEGREAVELDCTGLELLEAATELSVELPDALKEAGTEAVYI
jgi:aspartate/glutamate racemase